MSTSADVRPRPSDDDYARQPDGPDEAVLDNPAYWSLTGAHAHLAEVRGNIRRYQLDVSPFLGAPDPLEPGDWDDLLDLVGPGALVPLPTAPDRLPPGWEVVMSGPGVQLVDESLEAAPDAEAVRLGSADVPEMLALVAATKPGPFLPRTIELGTYLGIRRDGELVAMAGERLHPPGWTEISAVCRHSGYRGQGLATRLVRAVADGIRARGETPFLHAAADNTNTGRFIDREKLHHIDFEGQWFKVRGPSIVPRPPQGQPGCGPPPPRTTSRRSPGPSSPSCSAAGPSGRRTRRTRCAGCSASAGPLPDVDPDPDGPLVIQGRARLHQDASATVRQWRELADANRFSLRELAIHLFSRNEFVGTPTQVADQLDAFVQNGGSDGFIVGSHLTPGGLDEFVDKVVPLLQERGSLRADYTGSTLRENLRIPAPQAAGTPAAVG